VGKDSQKVVLHHPAPSNPIPVQAALKEFGVVCDKEVSNGKKSSPASVTTDRQQGQTTKRNLAASNAKDVRQRKKRRVNTSPLPIHTEKPSFHIETVVLRSIDKTRSWTVTWVRREGGWINPETAQLQSGKDILQQGIVVSVRGKLNSAVDMKLVWRVNGWRGEDQFGWVVRADMASVFHGITHSTSPDITCEGTYGSSVSSEFW
jgi:hypothetical protein